MHKHLHTQTTPACWRNCRFQASFQYVTLIESDLMARLVLFIQVLFLNKDQIRACGWCVYMIIFGVSMAVVNYPAMMFTSTVKSPVTVTFVILIPILSLSFYTSISGIAKAKLCTAHPRA